MLDNILAWFKSTNFYDYWDWLLMQPTSDTSGIIITGVVLVVGIFLVLCLGASKKVSKDKNI